MKKLLFLLIAANGILPATAQMKDSTSKKREYLKDALMPRWAVDVNLLGGVLTRDMTTGNSMGNYLNALSDANLGNLKFTNGTSFGGDVQLGYFFGASNHFGVGIGFMYLAQSGDATLDNFHVQYQSTDNFGEISRQVITANAPIKEQLQITNMNIPLVLKYKTRFSKHFGFTADLGMLYNVTIKNSYKTNASFDYEEIVKHVTTADGSIITVYDNSATPEFTDLQITKSHYNESHPANQTLADYFALEKGYGYNVGVGVAPTHKSGDVSFTSGSVGFLFRPAINYFFSDNVALTVGGYFMYQPFNNTPTNNYHLTDKVGDYSSVLNNVSKSNDMSYGGNLGIRFLFGKKAAKPANITVEGTDPTACGLADGTLTIHNLSAGKLINVNYSADGKPGVAPGLTVETNGSVKVAKLPAGSYTDISVTMGKHKMDGNQVTLVNPPINIYTSSTNPTAPDACDGTISVGGLKAGQKVTVNYSFNGSPKAPYIGIVGSNSAVMLSGLCAGTYSHITASAGDCKGNGSDITLTYVAPPTPKEPTSEGSQSSLADITKPILFEFGKTTIHPSSYPTLEQAVLEVGKNANFYIICEGHTDNTGTVERNEILSFKRANAVKQYLIKLGVDKERIIAVGRGARMPIATNDTPEGRARNRRVVMTLNERNK